LQFAVFFLIAFSSPVFAQLETIKTFPSKGEIKMFSNASFVLVYYSPPSLNTYRDRTITSMSKVTALAINPSGSSFAVISDSETLDIFSMSNEDERLFKIKDTRKELKAKPLPVAVAYSTDARHLLTGNSFNEIVVYDTRAYMQQFILRGNKPVTALAMSSNNYFIAAITSDNLVDIWNFETKAIRTKLRLDAVGSGLAFSPDASMLAVTSGNKLIVYNTRNWEIFLTYESEHQLASPTFNGDDKYVAFVSGGKEIVIYNIRKNEVTQVISEAESVHSCNFFENRSTSKAYLVSNRPKHIVFWNANGLNPFYGKIINQEVDRKMNEWVKMMQGETMEEYAIRVNDETRAKQMELFAQEAATALAGNRLAMENPFVGDYNSEGGLLSINFATLTPIEIPVPASEVSSFDKNKLKFENAVYSLTENDEFKLVYLEVTNEVNNKVYIYDNIGRTRMTAIAVDSSLDLVPLEILQIASQEEMQLQAVTENVMNENKQEKLISDNTQINVHTEVIADVDADGNKILNYRISYQYEVISEEFSARDDFPSGGYDILKSNAAMSLMKIIKSSFEEGDFAKYLEAGKVVKISITGSADGAPVRGKISYNGAYGDFVGEPYYQNGDLNNITITKVTGITSNPQLAFIRAAGVKEYLSKNISALQQTRNDYQFNIEVAEERGGEFRRIQIRFTIVDAFKQK
jgi:WD40 repeat protein